MTTQNEAHLKVYANRSVLVASDDSVETFVEGPADEEAQSRHAKIREAFHNGYLDDLLNDLRAMNITPPELDDEQSALLSRLVDSITSQRGRGLVGLAVLILAIKDIAPKQSVRLHKGNSRRGTFSWRDGLPMRGLDSDYNTPFLRRHGLLLLNNDGAMMTRSLAENYPYSKFYKAAVRGAKAELSTPTQLCAFSPD